MQAAITRELREKLCLAIIHGLVPSGIQEFEFTVDEKGQASVIEYWLCSERKPNEYTKVNIPLKILDQFVFHSIREMQQ